MKLGGYSWGSCSKGYALEKVSPSLLKFLSLLQMQAGGNFFQSWYLSAGGGTTWPWIVINRNSSYGLLKPFVMGHMAVIFLLHNRVHRPPGHHGECHDIGQIENKMLHSQHDLQGAQISNLGGGAGYHEGGG